MMFLKSTVKRKGGWITSGIFALLVTFTFLTYHSNFTVVSNIGKSFLDFGENSNIRKKCSMAYGPLPPVHINSSWIGNQWVPPEGYKIYDAREIQNYFSKHSILFIGDSTARRQYATMYAMLTGDPNNLSVEELDSSEVINVNKRNRTEECNKEGYSLCRYHAPTKMFDLIINSCLNSVLKDIIENPDFWRASTNYSLVIFVLGPWEVSGKLECGSGMYGRKTQTKEIIHTLFNVTSNNNNITTRTEFIWRTWGSHNGKTRRDAMSHNNYLKYLIDKDVIERNQSEQSMGMVSYIDWGQAMLPRLFGEDRIEGDISNHYGLEARTMFVQMLINHLIERERQKHDNTPWIEHNDNIQKKDDNSFSNRFMTDREPEKNIPDDKKQMYNDALSMFCETCSLDNRTKVLCQFRRDFMRKRYKMTDFDSIVYTMETYPNCNNSNNN